ncbi:MAG TPA: carbohydrate ABC transporter permease [Acidimicrobiia bacterium]|jgi:alpha-glucoside transport system permease protein
MTTDAAPTPAPAVLAEAAVTKRAPGETKTRSWLVRGLVLVIAVAWTIPTAGLLISSLRPEVDVSATGWWTVFAHPFELTQFTIANYERVLTAEGLFGAFINSLIVTIPATVIPITLAAFAAYGFAWTRFRGRSFLFAVVVGLLVIPLQMSLVPLLRLYGNYDLVGTFVGIWLAHTGFGLPLAIYLLYNYISQLPKDIFESAYIDGATPFTAFTRLVLPLSFPALASFAIFQFLWVWNDLLVSLVFLGTNPDVAVLTARVSQLVGSRGAAWHLLTAGAFVSMVVPLIVFLALQRFFVRGLLAGSVKG